MLFPVLLFDRSGYPPYKVEQRNSLGPKTDLVGVPDVLPGVFVGKDVETSASHDVDERVERYPTAQKALESRAVRWLPQTAFVA